MNAFEAIENEAEHYDFKVLGRKWRWLAKKVHLINTPVRKNNNTTGHRFYIEKNGRKHKVNIMLKMSDGESYYTEDYCSGVINGVGYVFVDGARVCCVLEKVRFDKKGVKQNG